MSIVSDTDTIAAVATPRGRGGVGIIRVSGPHVPTIARQLLGTLPSPRRAMFREFRDAAGEVLDQGLALYFPAPHSFTGDEVLELQGHGGPVVLDRLLGAVLHAGARTAEPGEFSRRAFVNDRIDLLEAEAIADLIDARSERAAQLALRTLQGEFSRRIGDLSRQLTALRVQVEAAVDFPEEELDLIADQKVAAGITGLLSGLQDIMASARQGQVLREGLCVAILGRPNAGKSTLMNRLSGRDSAIVTEHAGTTRDLIREQILLNELPVLLVDSAGLRHSDDPVERIGVDRAMAQAREAELILYLEDDTAPADDEDRRLYADLPEHIRRLRVRTKIDQTAAEPGLRHGVLFVSARDGSGIPELIAAITEHAGLMDSNEGLFMARRRHLEAMERATAALGQALALVRQGDAGDLIAEELRQAQTDLGKITGEVTSDDLLGEIFSSFCIGK